MTIIYVTSVDIKHRTLVDGNYTSVMHISHVIEPGLFVAAYFTSSDNASIALSLSDMFLIFKAAVPPKRGAKRATW